MNGKDWLTLLLGIALLCLSALVIADHIQVVHLVAQNKVLSEQTRHLVVQVHKGLVNQTSNRAANVNTWCGFDVKLKAGLVGYINQFPHAPKLHLPALNCQAIIAKTLASTKP